MNDYKIATTEYEAWLNEVVYDRNQALEQPTRLENELYDHTPLPRWQDYVNG